MVIIFSEHLASSHLIVKRKPEKLLNSTNKYGSKIVQSLKSMKRFAARLRKLLWRIYHKVKSNAKNILGKYKTLVGEYLENLKMRLKAHEVGLWKEELSQTTVYANSPQEIKKKVDDANPPRKGIVKEKGYAKVNTTWFGSAKNVHHTKLLKKNVKSMSEEVMKKLDEVLLKLIEV